MHQSVSFTPQTEMCLASCRFSRVVFVTTNNFTSLLLFQMLFVINPVPTRLFCAPKTKESDIVHPTPLENTLLPFSESIQVKFSESMSENESLDAALDYMDTMGSVLRWFIAFRFLTGNPQNQKPCSPC